MKVEVTKFNTRSLSTPIFATKNQDFVQKKKKIGDRQQPETLKSQPSW